MPSPHAKSPDVHAQEAYEPPSPSQPQHAHEPYSSHPLNSPLSTAENYSAGSMSAPLLSPDSARQSIGFTKAAFAFHDRLGSLRRKRASQSTSVVSGPESDISPTKDGSASTEDSPPQKGIKILRILQRTLTALLSLAIAFFQGRVYYTYKRTEHVPGCWPKTPQLMPTLLLFSVAIATFTFDVCMLLAYVARSKRYAQKFYNIAMNAHYIATSAKAVAYALTSIVCRLGFNFGNSSDTHMDLWSWTCTAKAAEQKQMNQAPSNCDTQVCDLPFWFGLNNLPPAAMSFRCISLI